MSSSPSTFKDLLAVKGQRNAPLAKDEVLHFVQRQIEWVGTRPSLAKIQLAETYVQGMGQSLAATDYIDLDDLDVLFYSLDQAGRSARRLVPWWAFWRRM